LENHRFVKEMNVPRARRATRLAGDVIRERFAIDTFSGAYGVTEAGLVSWQLPAYATVRGPPAFVNAEYFDVRSFDDEDNELPRGTEARS
jgi:carnitine-CoA ligase